jgi:colanic acid/amylovoran biosynthesis glycosyltransferase
MGELLRERGVTHLHCHFANHPATAGFIVHRLAGIPFSFTAHGSDLHVDRHMLREKVAEAAFVVAISEFNRAVILEACGQAAAAKVRVVHCGVDTAAFAPRPDRPRDPGLATPERPLEILCIGTLHEVKGQVHLVEACRLLAARGVPFRCTFVGDGPDAALLTERIAGAGLAGRVELAGRRTRAEVVELLATADVLVAPSVPTRQGKREGIPVVLIEAMASGLPVVASRLSGIPELVEDSVGGILVEPGSPAEIADALARLAAEPALRARLGAGGRAAVERGFDLDAAARALVRMFRSAAAGEGAA